MRFAGCRRVFLGTGDVSSSVLGLRDVRRTMLEEVLVREGFPAPRLRLRELDVGSGLSSGEKGLEGGLERDDALSSCSCSCSSSLITSSAAARVGVCAKFRSERRVGACSVLRDESACVMRAVSRDIFDVLILIPMGPKPRCNGARGKTQGELQTSPAVLSQYVIDACSKVNLSHANY